MAMPLEGSKKIVGVTGPCSTEEVTTTPLGGGKIGLDVSAVVAFPAFPGKTVIAITDTVIPAAAIGFPLPAVPAATLRATYQNVTAVASVIRIRPVAAVPPAGPSLQKDQAVSFGGFGGAVPIATPFVADGDPLVPTHLAIIFELP